MGILSRQFLINTSVVESLIVGLMFFQDNHIIFPGFNTLYSDSQKMREAEELKSLIAYSASQLPPLAAVEVVGIRNFADLPILQFITFLKSFILIGINLLLKISEFYI